ncbi:hypothetical protein AVHY2522_24850 [Acidovorax sp. SUPP2522]|uniref:NAD(P)-binding protein n=1 Tax=unclassified Acidovorax TaxID=2684926 RepID=UPI00234B5E40|nr:MULTISPECIES: NAD(P)-binding protein [unclassified Acidovorax]WCM98321.1 NAD(P)-binding protein [Acidovorax sp. GBBC 1281]GKT20130.1 hypothetical protein AVHY2522_24850 [Acidovorax sp. SUPP2522]
MTNLSQSKPADRSAAVCVIGAGPGGLSAARALKMQGLDYDQFERHSDLGGLWDTTNPGSPVYASTHFISSRDLSGFIGYPMPRDYPDYPSHRQILAYLRSFADAFGLREKIQFNTGVQRIRKDSASRWVVELADGTRQHKREPLTTPCLTNPNREEWAPVAV